MGCVFYGLQINCFVYGDHDGVFDHEYDHAIFFARLVEL